MKMTGKDLIIYILANDLEDRPIIEDGKPIGFLTIIEAAEQMNVGIATIRAWIKKDWMDHAVIGDTVYIPANFKLSLENIL